MADGMFNIGRGRLYQAALDGEDLIVVLLKAAEADDALNNYDTLADVLAEAGNTEADFTNYVRKVIANGDLTPSVDDGNNRLDIDFPDQTWTSAGGASNNTTVKLVVCIDGASDAARVPISHHDFAVTTDGSDVVAQLPSGGFYRSGT